MEEDTVRKNDAENAENVEVEDDDVDIDVVHKK